jgi:hypothetical protein
MSKKFWRIFDVAMLCAFLPFLIGVTLYLNGLNLLTPFWLCIYMVVISLYSMCVGTKIYGLILLVKQENNFKNAMSDLRDTLQSIVDEANDEKDINEDKDIFGQ